MHPVQLSQKLIRLMARRNLTQEELGAALNLSHTTVGRWLAGKSRPYPRIAQQLAEYFGLPVEAIIDDSKPLPPPSDVEILAASDTPVDPETAQRLSERIGGVAERIRAFAESHPKAETVAQVIVIEELESLLGHAQGLVESLERIKSRLTATAGREPKPKKPLIVPAPPHHRNPRQPGEGGGSAASA